MASSKTQGKWTIRDIAREAGVCIKTVSHVMNNKPGVGEETRARVMRIIQEAGYQPHMGARALRARNTGAMGVIVPAPSAIVPLNQSLFVWTFEQLYRLFGQRGEHISFDMNPYADKLSGDYARGLWQQLYKACILVGPLAVNDTTIVRIHKWGAPYLAVGRLDGLPELSSATIDYEEGAYMSTKFLIERGHTHIGMLKALPGYQPGVERLRGYVRALEEAGITPDMDLVHAVSFEAHVMKNRAYRILANPNVTAIVDASGLEDAASIREAARLAGRKPGDDFEIVSWTYVNDAAVMREAAAHLWLPVREAAGEGLEKLADWVYGERSEPVNVLYRPTLSTDVHEREVAKPRRLFTFSE